MLLDNISSYSSCLISTLHSSSYEIPLHQKVFKASFHFDGKSVDYCCDVDVSPASLLKVLEPVKIPIVLEGINIWFLYQPMDIWYPFLFNLISKKTVILVFHQELNISDKIDHLQILRDLTQLHIEFTPTSRDVLFKKTSGKVQRESKIDKSTKIATSAQPTKTEAITQPNNPKQDPISSFNLSLTDQQRSQKDGVVLPYTKAQDSIIDYIVDKDDDFDSDDPDDDLDI